ncbi:hypothetical protein [Methylobacter sp. BlB1]|uniref:hypothetical protein n=1 Tax=Methylobacter sp. BlB1 TaxID=2785914 RepID=UPI0018963BEB|nr:hypothetical protein [Methylobacter sp. BlB1]MBF6647694.1 hypothetical protein [Methylobacter sp. BlB1]
MLDVLVGQKSRKRNRNGDAGEFTSWRRSLSIILGAVLYATRKGCKIENGCSIARLLSLLLIASQGRNRETVEIS